MRYYVTFYKNEKAICGTWQEAENMESAMLDAAFKLETRFGGTVEYNKIKAKEEAK